jgi:hypothetical protein
MRGRRSPPYSGEHARSRSRSPLATASRRLAHERLEELLDEEGADLPLVLRLLNLASNARTGEALLEQLGGLSSAVLKGADDRLQYYESDEEETVPDGSRGRGCAQGGGGMDGKGGPAMVRLSDVAARAAVNRNSGTLFFNKDSGESPTTRNVLGTPSRAGAVEESTAFVAARGALAAAMEVGTHEAARALRNAGGDVDRAMLELAGGPSPQMGSPDLPRDSVTRHEAPVHGMKREMQREGGVEADPPTNLCGSRGLRDAHSVHTSADAWGAHDLPSPHPGGRPPPRAVARAAVLSPMRLHHTEIASCGSSGSPERPKTSRWREATDPFHYVVPSPERDRATLQCMRFDGTYGGAQEATTSAHVGAAAQGGTLTDDEDEVGGGGGCRDGEVSTLRDLNGDSSDDSDEDEEAEAGSDGSDNGWALTQRRPSAEVERPKTARGGPGSDPFGYVSPSRAKPAGRQGGIDHWVRGESSGTNPEATPAFSPASRVAGTLSVPSRSTGDGNSAGSPARTKLEAARAAREAAEAAAAHQPGSPVARAALEACKDEEERALHVAVEEDRALFEEQTRRLSPARAGLVAAHASLRACSSADSYGSDDDSSGSNDDDESGAEAAYARVADTPDGKAGCEDSPTTSESWSLLSAGEHSEDPTNAEVTIDDLPSEPLNLGDLRNIAAGISAFASSAGGASSVAPGSAPPAVAGGANGREELRGADTYIDTAGGRGARRNLMFTREMLVSRLEQMEAELEQQEHAACAQRQQPRRATGTSGACTGVASSATGGSTGMHIDPARRAELMVLKAAEEEEAMARQGFAVGTAKAVLAGDPEEGLRPDEHPAYLSGGDSEDESDEDDDDDEDEDDEEEDDDDDEEEDDDEGPAQNEHINARLLGSLKVLLDRELPFGAGGLPTHMQGGPRLITEDDDSEDDAFG